jgi:peroxiredoxin
MMKWRLAALVLISLLLVAERSYAAGLDVGDKAPDWSALPGIDDKQHSLSDYKDATLVVLVFTCNHCPVAVAYEDRLVQLQKDYQAKGVRLVAVNVNTLAADRLDKMKERAKEKEFNFPYLYDESQKIGHEYGARVTPHVFVLDRNRKIAYIGPVDDNQNPKKVSAQHLRDAIDALLSGEEPPATKVKPFGCSIKYN